MNKNHRKTVIAGNWKMNKTPTQAAQLAKDIIVALPTQLPCEVVICPPYIDLATVCSALEGTGIHLGAQNCHFAQNGAYTGEISPQMLWEIGVTHAIIGHSERRSYYGETDETVNLRTKAAIAQGLTAIVCVGESLAQRENEQTEQVCSAQVQAALAGLAQCDLQNIIIAYEPIWAIGTGKTATAAQADEACGQIRAVVGAMFGQDAAQGITIQYGGSMNAQNAAELLACENIDGGLIGGASLKATDFAQIVMAAQ